MEDSKKLRLIVNHPTMEGRSLDEIADIAIACQIDRDLVTQWLRSQKFKAMNSNER